MTLFGQEAEKIQIEVFAALALGLAARKVPAYDTRFSRHDFTRPQLVACLVIKAAHGLTYRGIHQLLRQSPGLREAIGLRSVPHYTTLESYANAGQLAQIVQGLLDALMLEIGKGERPVVDEAAMDSTGLSVTTASVYFEEVKQSGEAGPIGTPGQSGETRTPENTEAAKRRADHRRRHNAPFIKVSVAVLCGLILPAAVVVTVGRSPDNTQSKDVVNDLARRVSVKRLYADKGYDGEPLHALCRETHGIESFIPPIPKTADGSVRTRYRSMMNPLPRSYANRSHVEAFFSGMKRTAGSGLRARTDAARIAEALLRVIAYGIRR